ncbi:MAG: AAA family ATPase [Bacteroidetes bacterium]|nr:AAA family ATPase [Bacteroidota bacterium]
MPLKKVVIVGPESTGKSSLCEGLAAHYGTVWVREYAREYLLKNGMGYKFGDLRTIAEGQLALEEKGAVEANGILFIDTDMYVMKVWGEFVFGQCDPWILNQIVTRKYDAYLLCKTDLPWVKDELREYPDLLSREQLFHIYRDILINQSTPWAEIGGQADERLEAAIKAVDKMIGGHSRVPGLLQ